MVAGRSSQRRSARMREIAQARSESVEDPDGGQREIPLPMPPMPMSMPFSRRRGRRRGDRMGEAGGTKTILPKLMVKLIVYGIVMAVMNYGKRGGEGAGGAADNEGSVTSLTSVGVEWTGFLQQIFSGFGITTTTSTDGDASLLIKSQVLSVGNGQYDGTNITVHIVPSIFLPDAARRWKEGAAYEWSRGKDASNSAFHFVSMPQNDEDETFEARTSTAPLARSERRHATAHWQLDFAHPVSRDISETLSSMNIREKLAPLGIERDAVLKEASVVHYSVGNFMFSSGTGPDDTEEEYKWLLIISLADKNTNDQAFEASDDAKHTVASPIIRFACTDALGGNIEGKTKEAEWCDEVVLEYESAAIIPYTMNDNGPSYEIVVASGDVQLISGTYIKSRNGISKEEL